MRNYYLVFDYAQKRIGWGPVNRKAGGCGSIQEGEVAAEFALGAPRRLYPRSESST